MSARNRLGSFQRAPHSSERHLAPNSHNRRRYAPYPEHRRSQKPHTSRRHSSTQESERTTTTYRKGKIKYLTRDEITSLAGSRSADVLACVHENEAGFLAAYEHEHYCKNPLMMRHLVKLLYLLVKTDDLDRIVARILARILSADGSYALFIVKLQILVKHMEMEANDHTRRENLRCLSNMLEIGSKAIEVIPRTILNTFPLLVIKKAIQDLAKCRESVDTLQVKVERLEILFEEARKQQQLVATEDSAVGVSEPPVSFVDLKTLPTLDEIHTEDSKIYLRPNVVKGPYRNWNHYLDVQYRLLREDFVRPLRHGIQHYCEPTKAQAKSQDVRLYKKVTILERVCFFNGVGFRIKFEMSHLKRVNWEHSRRLIFGSLLCLSSDNFERSIMFASVVNRDASLLEDGQVIIKLEGDIGSFKVNPAQTFTMVESTAYYEAYRHILMKLKDFSSTSDKIPFRPYIVDCKLSNIPAPSYAQCRKEMCFDLSSVLGVRCDVILQKESSWPHHHSTCLDESQLNALKMALSKEVSVIQGPPGTGKTFIGLKTVEAFLANRNVWDRNKEAPILVVCYTNHALDQFLEGIQQLESCPNIVRIGGRCKSSKLLSCVLRNKVKEYQDRRLLPHNLVGKLADARGALLSIQTAIQELSKYSITCDNHLIPLSELRRVISNEHYNQLSEAEPGREIETWLELGVFKEHFTTESELPMETDDMYLEGNDSKTDFISVDSEVNLMHEDRILEGEEIEFHATSISHRQRSEERGRSQVSSESWRSVRKSGHKRSKIASKDFIDVRHIWNLSQERKWQLYNSWVEEYVQSAEKFMNECYDKYEQACEQYSDCQWKVDECVLRSADVIGMTTTGAAKHHHFLKSVHPKVVIFEEAAEILEAHVMTSLAPSVQQLILIGDHKQLRPKPNCYELEVKFELGVSLFERLVCNKIPYIALSVQHRMRPDISQLVRTTVYPDLADHKSVTTYNHIRGIAKDVFMIDHTHPELSNQDTDVTTHVNIFEADFLVALCRYLLKQGYDPKEITILTMYRGQLLELKRRMQRQDFDGIRVAAVDDFQGEENEIVLLSLVRSNPEKNIGFLSSSNRTCVSLSRAKKGLYIIGNASMLQGKEKTIWPEIIRGLEHCQCVGTGLPLYCRIHKNNKVFAKMPEDFLKCPEGGCDKLCRARLPCGHYCPRMCHPADIDHTKYKCSRDCPKSLPCGHKCKQRCCDCSSGCPPCRVKVKRILAGCGHKVSMPCHCDPETYSCPRLCENILICGHPCQSKCSEPCTLNCSVKVERFLECGHEATGLCYESLDSLKCTVRCEFLMECGHTCVGSCHNCHKGRLHKRCEQTCGRQLVCGHTCNFPCASNCPPCTQGCTNFCVHSQCYNKCYEICTQCTEPCPWKCRHFKCSRQCGEFCDRPPCDKPCTKRLRCGHQCIGLCGEKCPPKCQVCNKDEVCEILFGSEEDSNARFLVLEDCSHFFEVNGLDTWVQTVQEGDCVVQFKTCPKCKTPIRKSLRYGNHIKETLRDVEQIKRKQLLPTNDLQKKFREFESMARCSVHHSFVHSEIATLKLNVKQEDHPHHARTLLVQINILTSVLNIKDIITKIEPSSEQRTYHTKKTIDDIVKSLEALKTSVMQDFLSTQQELDMTFELRRISCAAKICHLLLKVCERNIILEDSDKDRLERVAKQLHESGWKCERTTEEEEVSIMDLIKHVSSTYQVDGLSEKERLMITAAVGLTKGHWFKCANGHYYCIGECGGATQTSKCPDCGEVIGGERHALARGNQHAPEMDSSAHPAWSEAANMANYDQNQF